MPTSTTCIWGGETISVQRALEIRDQESSPVFACVSCGQRVRPHAGGGHAAAHFEHLQRNPECPLSHSDSYTYGGSEIVQDPDSAEAIEGYSRERNYLSHHRNSAIVLQCKERDNYTCRACGLSLRVNGRAIIECHHLKPLADEGERITNLNDLVSLCPTCHRVAHTSSPPLSLDDIAKITGRL